MHKPLTAGKWGQVKERYVLEHSNKNPFSRAVLEQPSARPKISNSKMDFCVDDSKLVQYLENKRFNEWRAKIQKQIDFDNQRRGKPQT